MSMKETAGAEQRLPLQRSMLREDQVVQKEIDAYTAMHAALLL